MGGGPTSTANQQYNDPSWLSTFLQQHAGDQINVSTGPGGVTITVAGESVFIGPSQTGVTQSFQGHIILTSGDVDASLPFLVPGTTSFTLSDSWTSYFMNYITDGQGTFDPFGVDTSSSTATSSTPSGLTLPEPSALTSTDWNVVYNGLLQYGDTTNSALTPGQQAALQYVAQQIANGNKSGGNPALSSGDADQISSFLTGLIPTNTGLSTTDSETVSSILGNAATTICAQEYTSGLTSTDGDTVYYALLAFLGFDKDPNLTAAQQAEFTAALHQLADNIAKENKSGKPDPALSSLDPGTLAAYLMQNVDISSFSDADKSVFEMAIGIGAGEITSLNAASGQAIPMPTTMTEMDSVDSGQVLEALIALLEQQDMSADEITALMPELTTLSQKIAAQNGKDGGAGINICDCPTLTATLSALLGNPTDPATVAAIADIATAYSGVTTNYYTQETYSTNSTIVLDGLVHLSNVNNDPNLSADEKASVIDYLKLMAAALAFMSTIRARIAIMEAEFREQETQGKLANIQDQTKVAQTAYSSGILQLSNTYKEIMHAMAQAALWGWLGPVLIALTALIAVILTVLTGPAGFGLMGPILCAVIIATTIAMTAIMILEQTTHFVTGMCNAMGIHNKVAQDAVNFGVQALIMAVMTAATLGAMAGVCAAELASQELLMDIFAEVVNTGNTTIACTAVGLVVGVACQSGLIPDALTLLFKKCGMNQQDAEIAAMAVTAVLMLAMFFAMIATAPEMAAGSATDAAASGAGSDLADLGSDSNVGIGAAGAPGMLGGAAGTILQAGEDLISEVTTAVLGAFVKMLSYMKTLISNPPVFIAMMQILGQLAQVAGDVEQAMYDFEMGNLNKAQADVALINADAQALLTLLQMVAPAFDMTIDGLNADSKSFMQFFSGLLTLFGDMITSASSIVSNVTATS